MNAIIFDVDNTLCDAGQYFSGASSDVAEYLSKKHNLSKNDIYKELECLWKAKTSMYPYLFNDLLNNLNLKNDLRNVIDIFNGHACKLEPYSDVLPTLKELKKRKYKLGIITDGSIERQKRKLKSLGLNNFFDEIIFTKKMDSPKPSQIPFQEAIKKLEVNPQNSFYIGDNPLVDFEGSKKTGMKTVRILRGEFKNIQTNQYIDYEINSLDEIVSILEEFDAQN